MYESPIDLFSVTDYAKQVDEQIENTVYKAITKVGVNVNKEELIKALAYDRNQYEKGYADGRAEAEQIIRCKDCRWWIKQVGRCYLGNGYHTGEWYCANAEPELEVVDDE